MEIVPAVLIGLVALILTPGVLFYYDVTPKLAILLVGAAVLCFARPRRLDRRWLLLSAATLLSAAVSTALSVRPAVSFYGSTWRRYGLVAEAAVLLVGWSVAQSDRRRLVVAGIAVTSSVAALYGIAQYFGYDPLLPAAAYHVGEGVWTIVRPPGTFGYVSYFATWLLTGGFLSISLRNRFGYAAAALSWGAMLLTGTRAAILGLAAGALVILYRRGFRVSRRNIAIGLGMVACVGVFYFSTAGHNLRSRTRWFVEDRWGGARPLLWRDSLRMSSHRPFLGYGPETFLPTFPLYKSPELARAYPDFAHESPHNIFLDALVAQGILGLACLAGFCWLGFRAADPWVAAAFAACVIAQQFTTFTIPTALLFYTCVALATAKPGTPIRLPRYALAPVSIAFVLLTLRLVAADHALAETQHALSTVDLGAADERYRTYTALRLPGGSADLWFARSLFDLAQRPALPLQRVQALQMASAAAARAAQTVEDPFDAWYTLANIRAAQGDATGVEAALRRAIAADPTWFKPHWTLARLLYAEGRRAEARSEALTAVDLNGGKDPEVTQTTSEIRRP